jgi:hypothetical protein
MRMSLYELMRIIEHDTDAAIASGWTPVHWHQEGFAALVRRRLQTVYDLRIALASLGATEALKGIRSFPGDEQVDWYEWGS